MGEARKSCEYQQCILTTGILQAQSMLRAFNAHFPMFVLLPAEALRWQAAALQAILEVC